jgi:hypothetical protein
VQASSDLSILDFDIPYSFTFVASVTIEILVIICIMVSVTWQALIVAIPAMVASIFIQVYHFTIFLDFSISFSFHG